MPAKFPMDEFRKAVAGLLEKNGHFMAKELESLLGLHKTTVHDLLNIMYDNHEIERAEKPRGRIVKGKNWRSDGAVKPPIVTQTDRATPTLPHPAKKTHRGQDEEIARIIFGKNPQQRTPFVLCLDLSGSMNDDDAIGQLNGGIEAFVQDLLKDDLAPKRVQIAIVTFGKDGVRIAQDFVDAESFRAPRFAAGGRTPMGEAVLAAIDLIRRQKNLYSAHSIASHAAWIFVISDGKPTDDIEAAKKAVHDEAAKPKEEQQFSLFPVAVRTANRAKLQEISPMRVKELRDLNFKGMFLWISQSLKTLSRSGVGQRTRYQPTSSWSGS